MNNLVIGTALNYDIEHVKAFVQSLRNHYSGEVIFLVSDISENFEHYLSLYEIETYKIPNSTDQSKICAIRHHYYKEIIENRNFDKILMTDVRDVIFQKDPFSHNTQYDLEFFEEKKLLSECECHRHWFVDLNIYGKEVYESLGNKNIICAGTTIGTKKGVLEYLNIMIPEVERLEKELSRPAIDQPSHIYLIYNNKFSNYKCYKLGEGPVSTMNNVSDLKFDLDNNLLNDDGSIVAIVHQWDRTPQKDIFYNKAIS